MGSCCRSLRRNPFYVDIKVCATPLRAALLAASSATSDTFLPEGSDMIALPKRGRSSLACLAVSTCTEYASTMYITYFTGSRLSLWD